MNVKGKKPTDPIIRKVETSGCRFVKWAVMRSIREVRAREKI